MDPLSDTRKAFDEPAVYSIAVQGELDAEWCDRLGGMAVTVAHLEGGSAITTLMGQLRDQASLSGVLETLYELQLPVIAVQRLAAGV